MSARIGGYVLAAAAAALVPVDSAAAQSWRLRFDVSAQLASYRGVVLDSLPGTDVVVGPTGGPVSPDGVIARCPGTTTYCYVFRPGEIRRGGPALTNVDLSLWGLGVSGLRVQVRGRAGVDLGSADVWPGTDPAMQLLEGYAEYATGAITGRIGRQQLATRLGWQGFDGGRVVGRLASLGIEGEMYAGLGLGQATALPVSSPALDPLDEFRPQSRQLLVGGALGWRGSGADVRLDYQREVDRDTRNFWSERIALSGAWRFAPRWSLAAGSEYDLSNQWFGTSELTLGYAARGLSVNAGVRQYRPFFPLWTIWGVFSPAPYRAANGTIRIAASRRVQLTATTEYFRFAETETETPLVRVDHDGWRTGISAAFTPSDRWRLSASYRLEYGPGASSDGFDASATWHRGPLRLSAYGAMLTRPLEFRLSQSELVVLGVDAAWQAQSRLRLALGAARYAETRDRPDAATFDWNQLRLHARITWLIASASDALPLPPAIRRTPRTVH